MVVTNPSAVSKMFSQVQTFDLYTIPGKSTKDCFAIRETYPFRNREINTELPDEQPPMVPCSVTRLTISRRIAFRNVISTILNIKDANQAEQIADKLKEPKHLVSLPQMELLIAHAEWMRGQEYYAFVLDRFNHVRLLRVYGRTESNTFGVALARSHNADQGDVIYVRNLDEARLPFL